MNPHLPTCGESVQGKQGVKEAGRRRVGGAQTEGVGIRPRKCKLSYRPERAQDTRAQLDLQCVS